MTLAVDVPTSKSMTQRALIIAALADGPTIIERPLDCDDSRYLRRALRQLGTQVDWSTTEARIEPHPLHAPSEPLFCGNAGTAVRFGSCLSLLCEGPLVIDGNEHMRRRPIGALSESLRSLGVTVRHLESEGCPPMELRRVSDPPATCQVDVSLSSQYASGLMMVAPLLADGLDLELSGHLVSQPYLRMTATMMRRSGAEVRWDEPRRIQVASGRYSGGTITVEPDWSAAAFILAAARITGEDIVPAHLPPVAESLQGDAAIADMLDSLDRGALNEIDLSDAPDLIAPIAAACVFAAKPTRIRGAAHTRVKECDRVHVLCRELRKLGVDAREHDDGMDLAPLDTLPTTAMRLDPEADHRMAMTFGVLSLRIPTIEVDNPECVSKSFPDFWDVLTLIRQRKVDG